MDKQPYQLSLPRERNTSVVFASPHSGRDYSPDFLRSSALDERTIRSSEDAFIDLLLADVPDFGAPLLTATAPRAYVDLNRGADELDPALIATIGNGVHNPRVASGLGVIPRVVAGGRTIYRGKISSKTAQDRIDAVWRPYHAQLQKLLDQTHDAFGEAILIDFHSMPHEAIAGIARAGMPKPDVILGDRFGASASSDVVDRIEEAFLAAGLSVARNTPFAGAYIAQRYGHPAQNRHVVQVEIDRALYMSERLIRPNSNFQKFSKTLYPVLAQIAQIGRREMPLAAE